jgi:hypothetical protein
MTEFVKYEHLSFCSSSRSVIPSLSDLKAEIQNSEIDKINKYSRSIQIISRD